MQRKKQKERTVKEGGWVGSDDCMREKRDKELALLKEAVAASALPIASRS